MHNIIITLCFILLYIVITHTFAHAGVTPSDPQDNCGDNCKEGQCCRNGKCFCLGVEKLILNNCTGQCIVKTVP